MTDRPPDADPNADPDGPSDHPVGVVGDADADVATGPSAPSMDRDTAGLGPEASDADRRLLDRARALGELDLADRPDAFEELDSAVVAELRAIEDL